MAATISELPLGLEHAGITAPVQALPLNYRRQPRKKIQFASERVSIYPIGQKGEREREK
ncbi:hypothetical protein AG1IA_01302 [Rhizoctonia solani AG-1 IA]|uniref:Uncharacterized protein n=1 Tax=Thanatephorus cucumeris (strain AG1-IA) TaxID=983506 RepID=L8X2X3_THACA|nr:hypothetical protein AG1IA_01302 [Rhizoctonia solani AG-1 IA]